MCRPVLPVRARRPERAWWTQTRMSHHPLSPPGADAEKSEEAAASPAATRSAPPPLPRVHRSTKSGAGRLSGAGGTWGLPSGHSGAATAGFQPIRLPKRRKVRRQRLRLQRPAVPPAGPEQPASPPGLALGGLWSSLLPTARERAAILRSATTCQRPNGPISALIEPARET